MKIKKLALAAAMCALLCIISPLTLPLGPVNLSLCTLFLGITALIFELRTSITILTIYVLLGCIGLPVFSGFSSGIAHVLGPTGGFILGYFPFIAVVSTAKKMFGTRRIADVFSVICGTSVLYLCGCIWFMCSVKCNINTAVYTTVLPFVPTDTVKIILCIFFVDRIRNSINKK